MTHRIVVLGAGYAGLAAAKRAAGRLRGTDARVTLVNAADRFVERVRLHQLAAGQALADLPLATLLEGTGVELVIARVTGIDLPTRRVRLDAAPYELSYDTLVYALGSGADLDGVPGVREHAFNVATADEALRLRAALTGSPAPAGDARPQAGSPAVTVAGDARPQAGGPAVAGDARPQVGSPAVTFAGDARPQTGGPAVAGDARPRAGNPAVASGGVGLPREASPALAHGGDRLRAAAEGGPTVVVVGGGLTGIEAAAELAETHRNLKVELVTGDRVAANLSGRARLHLFRSFHRLGVKVREQVVIGEVTGEGLVLDDGRGLPADAVVWAAGFAVPGLAAQAGLATDARGRMIVDDTLRSVSHPEVFGVGDAAAAAAAGGLARMSCQTGIPMGLSAGNAIADLVAGRDPATARIRYVWTNISLGRRDGVTQFTRADDSPLGDAVLTGRASALFKEFITRGTVLTMRHPGPYLPFRRPGR
ncbi:NAD(P)/FAD-dependent oxidoreductase [Nonomuraea sp. bgisy101]|uniref:NAD(P)/FAD-dependent oxidoreductase n=1 Tax=Nonomuraea sp. bgisy101 TaxID=3413784 RepID=UPI003D7239DE